DTTFSFKRRRGCQGSALALAALILAGVIGFSWFLIPAGLWPLKLLFIAPALLFTMALPAMFFAVFASNPVLRIDAQGIYFQEFSDKTVPWSDIESVTLTSGYWEIGHRPYATFKPLPGSDSLAYAVHTPSAYPKPRRMGYW